MLRRQFAFCSEVSEKLSARNVVHQEVQVAGILGEALQPDLQKSASMLYKEGMIYFCEYGILRNHMVYLL
jgi:hypothetical protein